MADIVTLLGFSAEAHGEHLAASLAALPGPKTDAVFAGGLAALVQTAAKPFSLGRKRHGAALQELRSIQMRLEAACMHGPFLPADPARAICARQAIAPLLGEAAPAILHALSGPGTNHQWDVVLRWEPEAVVAAHRDDIAAAVHAHGGGRTILAEAVAAALAQERDRREAALRQVVAKLARAIVPAGSSQTEVGLTVMLPAGAEAALEAALNSLPADIASDCSIDMRGPLPPVSFAAVRIDHAEAADVARAWKTLALPARVNAAALRHHWRDSAARLHPDRDTGDDGLMIAAGAAFRLLRDLLPSAADQAPFSLLALQRHAACRMSVSAPLLELVP